MEKIKILKQIMELPEKSRVLIGYDEMAQDLQTVMGEGERMEGLVDACEKTLEDLIKSGRIFRSFMAVTDQNIYVISRRKREEGQDRAGQDRAGQSSEDTLPEKRTVIPRKCVIRVEQREVPAEMKRFYDKQMEILTDSDRYDIYVGTDYERYLPGGVGKRMAGEAVLKTE